VANNFQPGFKCPVQFQPTGGGLTTLSIKSHNIEETVTLIDVTGTAQNGRTARIAGKADHKGTVNAEYDADLPPFLAPPSIRAGTTGICLFFVSPNKSIQVPVIVEKLHHESSVEGEVKWSMDVSENVLAGVVVYPATAGA